MKNPTENDASRQMAPDTTSALPAAVEVAIERRLNELRRERLDFWAKTINWWLSAITIVFALVAVAGGIIGLQQFWRIEDRANKSLENTEHLVKKIKLHEDVARQGAEHIREMTAELAVKNPEKAKQVVANIGANRAASLLDRAIARAVFLQQQDKGNAAIEKWLAIANFAKGVDNDQAARAWFSIGYLRQALKAKLSAYGEAILLKPNFAEAYSNRGNVNLDMLENDKALADFSMAILLKPEHPGFYFNRGSTRAKLTLYADAIADFDRAIDLNPSYGEAYYNRGNAKKAIGRKDDAQKDFNTARELARIAKNAKLEDQAEAALSTFDNAGGL